MLIWKPHAVACPCGASFSMEVSETLHVTRAPELRQRALDRTLHRARCPSCGRRHVYEAKLLYTDFTRFHWIGVCPPGWTHLWSGIERPLRDEFERVVMRAAPPFLRAMAPQFKLRLVFGYDQLAEKLYIFDGGLDDRVLERVKLRILAKHPDLLAPDAQLLFVPQDDAERLEFEVFQPNRPGHSRVGCERSLYDDELGREAEPDDSAFVNLGRRFHPPIADDDPRVSLALWSETPGEVFR